MQGAIIHMSQSAGFSHCKNDIDTRTSHSGSPYDSGSPYKNNSEKNINHGKFSITLVFF